MNNISDNNGTNQSASQNAEKIINFQKLTPVDNICDKTYIKAFDFVFKNDDLRNIAVSGPYGAGKTSVVDSWVKSQHKKAIKISLAHFSSDKENNDPNQSGMERKILNQLIHQIPIRRIPHTNFRNKSIDLVGIVFHTIAALFLIVTILYFSMYDNWCAYIDNFGRGILYNLLKNTTTSEFSFILAISAFAIGFAEIYTFFVSIVVKNQISKLSINGVEMEMNTERKDNSLFDKYLNEIVYLFDCAGYDNVIFEDIDRFECVAIFERLREINYLVNIHRQRVFFKKPLRFFYLLRDDVFSNKDRTKFFDYIIPIIPVIDGSNSADKLIDAFKSNNIQDRFSKSFINEISLFIDDMRILNNIVNEYLIYDDLINTTELVSEKMFAIIVYKNLFPNDFSKLHQNKGFVAFLFKHIDDYRQLKVKEICQEIEKCQDEQRYITSEIAESQDELEAISNYHNNIKKPSEYNKWKTTEYESRKRAIEDRKADKLVKLEQEFSVLSRTKEQILQMSLQELLSKLKIEAILNDETKTQFNDILTNNYYELLTSLLYSGYIDETYPDYITHFYGVRMSFNDKKFLRTVLSNTSKPYDYQLDDPKNVIEHLNYSKFEQESIINYSLIEYLLQHKTPMDYMKLKKVYDVIIFSELDGAKIMRGLFEYVSDIELLTKNTIHFWPQFLSYAIERKLLNDTILREYTLIALTSTSPAKLEELNQNNLLSEYISNSPDYLRIDQPEIEILINSFKTLNVKFTNIDFDAADEMLFNKVYENSLYELNWNNIILMLKKQYGISDESALIHRNYSLIASDKSAPLYEYINSNTTDDTNSLEIYLKVVLEQCEGEIFDDEEYALDLINNYAPNNNDEPLIQYFAHLKTEITNLTSIHNVYWWQPCLSNDVISKTVDNIVTFINERPNDVNYIVNYINSFEQPITSDNLQVSEIETIKKLTISIIRFPELQDDKFKQLVIASNIKFDVIGDDDISIKRVPILVANNSLKMNSGNLTIIRENYPDLLVDFISSDINQYIELIYSDSCEIEEMYCVLKSNLDDNTKIKIINAYSQPIPVANQTFSSEITKYILHNYIDEDDKVDLYKQFNDYDDEEIRKIIVDIAAYNIDTIIQSIGDYPIELIDGLLQRHSDDQSFVSKVFTALLSIISLEKAKHYINTLGLSDFDKVFVSGASTKIPVSSDNEKILKALVSRGWINSYARDPDNSSFFRIKR